MEIVRILATQSILLLISGLTNRTEVNTIYSKSGKIISGLQKTIHQKIYLSLKQHAAMRRSLIIALLFILSGIIISGCLNTKTPPRDVVTQRLSETFHENNILDGPIYSTSAGYYKGGLKELIEWVPHLKDMGFETIYLLPIWSDSSYTPDDYYKISPRLGTEEDLKNLVETVHKNDMKILLDLVTGYSNNKPNNFIYNNHPEWHLRDKEGNILRVYPDRWGPAIDRANPEVIKYFMEVAKYYVQEYDIDGWRIDAPMNNYDPKIVEGDHSATELLRQVKRAITSIRPDAILFTERPGPECENYQTCDPLFDEMSEISYDWFLIGQTKGGMDTIPQDIKSALLRIKNQMKQGNEPDSEDLKLISNWAEKTYGLEIRSKKDARKVQEKILLGEGSPSEFAEKMLKNEATSADLVDFFKKEKIWYNRTRARWFESHDTHARTMLIYPHHYKNLLILISTVPGVPFIHAGQETGETNADYFSGTINESIKDFYKKVFSIRSQNPGLKYGTIENIWKSGDNIYAYLRSYENNKVIVILNFQNKEATSVINIPQIAEGALLKDELSGETLTLSNPANFEIKIPAYGAKILVLKQ